MAHIKFGLGVFVIGLCLLAYSVYKMMSLGSPEGLSGEALKVAQKVSNNATIFRLVGFVISGFGATVVVLSLLTLNKLKKQ